MKRNDKPATRINRFSMTPSPQKALVTAANDSRAKKAKKCDGGIPSARWRSFHPREQGLSASHKTRIVVPSIAMQVRVPVRHAWRSFQVANKTFWHQRQHRRLDRHDRLAFTRPDRLYTCHHNALGRSASRWPRPKHCGAVQAAVFWDQALCRLRARPRLLPLACCWLDPSFLCSYRMTTTKSTCRARRLGQCYILRLDIPSRLLSPHCWGCP